LIRQIKCLEEITMIETKQKYLNLFDTILDSELFNQTFLLCSNRLSESDKIDILDYIAFRSQIQFCKNVIVLTNKNIVTGNIEIVDTRVKSSEIPLMFPHRSNTLFLVNIDFPYFENIQSWEYRVIQTLMYYKYSMFGFISGDQIIKIYEDLI
jgi:hypothetical protein